MKTIFLLAAMLAGAAAHACPGLAVEDGWIREAPPGAMMTAAYARLVNTGTKPLTIDGARAPGFEGVELHHTVVEDGMSRMREGRLEIAAGASAALAPGGWHLMLFGAERAPQAGETVQLTLSCGKRASEFPFTVKADR
jgi:periplasmic copper chaperone A